jgi:hypothetical protein
MIKTTPCGRWFRAISNERFGSLHCGGVADVSIPDGAIRNVSDFISVDVFRSMASRDGRDKVDGTHTEQSLPLALSDGICI